MKPPKIPTQFAPAERALPETIRHQAQYFQDVPLISQLFDAVPDIVLILNEQRQIVFANDSLLKAFNLGDKEMVLGLRPGEVLDCTHAFEVEGGCGTSEFCQTCGAVRAILFSLRGQETIEECRITQRNGMALDLQVRTTPLQVNNEKFSVFALKDISSEKRRQALEHIFFHDLLNLVTGLRGLTELIQEADPNEMEIIKAGIYNLSERLVDEIRTQRELSLAENNELPVQPAPIDSLSLLQEVISLYQSHKLAQYRQLRLDPDTQAVMFISDPVLLRRVIGNMVKNALEASQPEETVTVKCIIRKNKIKFIVHNPQFIPRTTQLQIFQRSFSTKGKGRGLGTYSMKLLSERYLNGRVSFTTSPEKGTTFIACYPLTLGSFSI